MACNERVLIKVSEPVRGEAVGCIAWLDAACENLTAALDPTRPCLSLLYVRQVLECHLQMVDGRKLHKKSNR